LPHVKYVLYHQGKETARFLGKEKSGIFLASDDKA
jgi:hypothetical protein